MKWVRCQVPDRVAGVAKLLATVHGLPVREVYGAVLTSQLWEGGHSIDADKFYAEVRTYQRQLGQEEDAGKGVISSDA